MQHINRESVDEVSAKIEKAVALFGTERMLLHPDCGFATFADNPICDTSLAEAKLAAIAQAGARTGSLVNSDRSSGERREQGS